MQSRNLFRQPLGINHRDILFKLSPTAQAYLQRLRATPETAVSKTNASTSRLNVAVIGAGICGLATALGLSRSGHAVTVFEARDSVSEVGAGIQLAPNATRQLRRWGLGDHLDSVCVQPQDLITKRWKDGAPIGRLKTGQLSQRIESPFIQVHRGDLHDGLQKLAEASGVSIRVGAKVRSCDHEAAGLTLESGFTFHADLIVSAEGIRSRTRQEMEGGEVIGEVRFVAYRATVSTSTLRADPELQRLVDHSHQLCWVGPERHCVTYAMSANSLYNMVFVVPSNGVRSGANAKRDLLELFAGWDPQLLRLISLAQDATVSKWSLWLADHPERWYNRNGKVILLGDSAHDMTPFLGQGAAMAIEDAACLEKALLKVRTSSEAEKQDDIAAALEIVHTFRSPRVKQIRHQAEQVLYIRHLPDGTEQAERDSLAAIELLNDEPAATPYIFSDPIGKRWLYAYDAAGAIMGTENVNLAGGDRMCSEPVSLNGVS